MLVSHRIYVYFKNDSGVICFDASKNVNFGDIVLKQVANEPVVQSPLENLFSLMPSEFFTFWVTNSPNIY